jgi:DnaJ family protein C protein 7
MKQSLKKGSYSSAISALESAMIALDPSLFRSTKSDTSFTYFTPDSDLSAQPLEWLILRGRILLVAADVNTAQQAAHYGMTKYGHATSPGLLHLRALALYLADSAASSVPSLLQRALSFDPDHKPSRDLLRLTKNVERVREEAKDAFGKSEWQKSIDLYRDAIATLRSGMSVEKFGWWELDEGVEYGDDADSRPSEENWAEKEAWRGGVVRVKCLSNIATAQAKLSAFEDSASAASLANSLLLVLSFPTSHAEAHAEAMRNSINESLFYKLHLRLADSYTKLERHAEAVRAYTVAEGIKPNDPEVARAKRTAAKAEKLASKKDYYKILGLDKNCNEDEIRKAYRKCALQYHPDKQAALSDAEKVVAEEKFKEVSEAYNCLIDPQKRRAHDTGADMEDGFGMGGGGMGGFPGGVGKFWKAS